MVYHFLLKLTKETRPHVDTDVERGEAFDRLLGELWMCLPGARQNSWRSHALTVSCSVESETTQRGFRFVTLTSSGYPAFG